MRPVNGFVTAGTPTGAAREPRGVVAAADQKLSSSGLLLEMALKAKILVPLNEQLVVHRPVRIMTSGAAFADSFMLKNKGSPLGNMTVGAGIHLARERKRAAFDRVALMRVVTIGATYLSRENRMAVRQIEFAADIKMALKTSFGRSLRINDGVTGAAGFRMHTAGAVTAFATDVFRIGALRFQPRVSRGGEVFDDLPMAVSAIL